MELNKRNGQAGYPSFRSVLYGSFCSLVRRMLWQRLRLGVALGVVFIGCLGATLLTASPLIELKELEEEKFSKKNLKEWKQIFDQYRLVQATDEVSLSETDEVGASETDEVNISETDEVGASETDEVSLSETDEVGASETDEVNISETDEVSVSETDETDTAETVTESDTETSESTPDEVDTGKELDWAVVGETFGLSLEELEVEPKNPRENKKYSKPRYVRPRILYKKNRSVTLKAYEATYSSEEKERARERIEQAQTYLEAGEGETFSAILNDIIRQYHYSKEATLASLRLGEYYETLEIPNALKSIDHYVYVINLHYHSGYEEEALFQLGLLLDKEKYYTKSEEVLLHLVKLIDKRNNKNFRYKSIWREKAEKHLALSYASFIHWAEEKRNVFYAYKYKSKIKNLMKRKARVIQREKAAIEKTIVEETAVEETAAEETAVEETAVEETVVEETAVEETAVEETEEIPE